MDLPLSLENLVMEEKSLKTQIVWGFMLWSWGWELNPLHVEISPSKPPIF